MLTILNGSIVHHNDQPIHIRSIGLGGWLMLEGYMLGGDNIPESKFKEILIKEAGEELAAEFIFEFRNRFITANDFKINKYLGFNCVRLPFNYRLLEQDPELVYLSGIVEQITKQGLYVILDMHAVPGAQNPDWHADASGKAYFWEDQKHRVHYLKLWDRLSRKFKDHEMIAGYDVMNEPVTDKTDLLRETFKEVIKVIRENNDQHIIFLEGNNWARDIEPLQGLFSENVALSIHFYDPFKFTFDNDPKLTYPGEVDGLFWNKATIRDALKKYSELKVPVLVGEFGVAGSFKPDKLQWVKDMLAVFKELGFHWSYWTFKSVAGTNFPDGIFTYPQGKEIQGMNNIGKQLLNNKAAFYSALDTRNFKLNQPLLEVIKHAQ